jgi:hypothetical protein
MEHVGDSVADERRAQVTQQRPDYIAENHKLASRVIRHCDAKAAITYPTGYAHRYDSSNLK